MPIIIVALFIKCLFIEISNLVCQTSGCMVSLLGEEVAQITGGQLEAKKRAKGGA